MLLKRLARCWLVAGLHALGACYDFTLVEPEPPLREGPALSVQVVAASEESTRYSLNAFFYRGTDARGEPTQVVDPRLYVEGTPLLPERVVEPGTWLYHWEHTPATTGDGADSIRVGFPAIANSSPATYAISIPVTRRAGPADIALTRGEDLVLRVSPVAGAPPELSGRVDFWMLEIRGSCASDATRYINVTGESVLPSELRVPWEWLEAVPTGSIAACLRALSSFQPVGSPYPVGVSVFAQIVWRITVVEPAA